MAREKTWQFDMNRVYAPASGSYTDIAKYVLWYYKAFLTAQIGACYTLLAPTVTAVTPSASGGALADATYYYRVAAIAGGPTEGPASNEVTAVVTGGGGAGSVALTWTAVAGATGYQVYRGTVAGSQTSFYTPGNVTTWTDTGAAPAGSETPTGIGTWTVIGSSDGTTAGMDGLDRWTNTYTAGKINRNAAGAAHSWVVLRSPLMASKLWYILLDWSTAADNQIAATLGVDAPPVGGNVNYAPTVQSPAALPGVVFSPGSTYPFIPQMRVHGQLATDGSFNILLSRDFNMRFNTGFLCHLLANYKGTDAYPVWMHIGAGSSAYGTAGYCDTPGASALDSSANAVMRYPDGTGSGNYGLILPSATNMPPSCDAFDGSFVDWPCVAGAKSVSNYTVRGRLQDIYYAPYTLGLGVPNPGSVDNVGSPEYMLVGLWWFPTNAIPIIY
jgi:hypothetical protein